MLDLSIKGGGQDRSHEHGGQIQNGSSVIMITSQLCLEP